METQKLSVVYFDQCLGAGHAKPWLKLAFLMFFVRKHEKKEEGRKMRQENSIWGACKQMLVRGFIHRKKTCITVSKRVYQGFQRFPRLAQEGSSSPRVSLRMNLLTNFDDCLQSDVTAVLFCRVTKNQMYTTIFFAAQFFCLLIL